MAQLHHIQEVQLKRWEWGGWELVPPARLPHSPCLSTSQPLPDQVTALHSCLEAFGSVEQ